MIKHNNLCDLAEAYFSVTVKKRARRGLREQCACKVIASVSPRGTHGAQKFKISHFAARFGNRCAACASPCVCPRPEGEGAPDVSKNNGIDPLRPAEGDRGPPEFK